MATLLSMRVYCMLAFEGLIEKNFPFFSTQRKSEATVAVVVEAENEDEASQPYFLSLKLMAGFWQVSTIDHLGKLSPG